MSWMTDIVQANQLQWDGRTACHFEAYEVALLDPDRSRAWWLRYTVDAPLDGEPYSTLWGAHFSEDRPGDRFALRTEFPVNSFAQQSDGFHIRVSKGELMDGGAKGGLRNPKDPSESLRWNVRFRGHDDPVRVYPKKRMYKRAWPPARVLAPMPLARASGIVEVGEQRYRIDDGLAHQSHSWGTRHFDAWAWGLATRFREDPHAYVYGLWGVPRVGGRQLTAIHYRHPSGRHLTFDEVTSHQKEEGAEARPGVWTFEAKGGRHTISGRFSASLQKTVGVTLDDPEGTHRYVHHCGVADATLEIWRRRFGKPELEETLTAKGTAVLQQGAQRPFEDIEFYI